MRKYATVLLFFIASVFFVSASSTTTFALSGSSSSINPVWCGMAAAVGYDTSGTDCDNIFTSTNNQASATQANAEQSPTQTNKTYVALGDSVAAGDGLPLAANASADDTLCARSPKAYSNYVASKLHMTLRNVSCAGATVGDLLTSQEVGDDVEIPSQLSAAFSNGTPDLITITAGANDVNWINFIRACYAFDCTRAGYAGVATGYRALLNVKLNSVLADIYYRSNGRPPKVVITGYYNPLSPACTTAQQAITPAEISWLSSETTKLNQTIQNVSSAYSFVQFVPLNFKGHDMCSSSPWVQGLAAPAPLHPTSQGQQVIACAILSAVQ